MENEKKKDTKPDEVLKVQKHQKQGYSYISSALELDESQGNSCYLHNIWQ